MRRLAVSIIALLVATAASAATFTVDDPDSGLVGVDAVLGDGICRTATGTCTVRAALQEAHATAGPDDIVVPAGLVALVPEGDDTTRITEDLRLSGGGEIQLAGGAPPDMGTVDAGAVLTLEDITLGGGGFVISGGMLIARRVTFGEMAAPGSSLQLGASARFENCVLRANTLSLDPGTIGTVILF